MAANNPHKAETVISCIRAVSLDTQLHIRHGSAPVLRGFRWLVALSLVAEPLLGRPLLEALGSDCQKVLGAAADQHGGTAAVSAIVAKETTSSSERVGRILDGVF